MAKRKRPSIPFLLTWTVCAILLAAGALTTGMRDVSHNRAIFMYVVGSIVVVACLYHWITYFIIKE